VYVLQMVNFGPCYVVFTKLFFSPHRNGKKPYSPPIAVRLEWFDARDQVSDFRVLHELFEVFCRAISFDGSGS
jgi:hypothetical protein